MKKLLAASAATIAFVSAGAARAVDVSGTAISGSTCPSQNTVNVGPGAPLILDQYGRLCVNSTGGGGGGGGGAVYGPTSNGSAAANPPNLLGGTANGTGTGTVENAKVNSSGQVSETLDAVGGTSLALGQTTMSASVPVSIASNQSAIPASESGTWNVGLSSGSNTIGSISNTSFGISGTLPAFAATPTVNSAESGTWNVGLSAGTNAIGSITNTSFAATQATASNLNAAVVGNVAAGGADSGNGIKISGVYNTSLPNLSNTYRGDIQLDSNSRILVDLATAIPAGTNAIGSITNTSFAATQATAANLNATVVGTGTFAVQAAQSGTWNVGLSAGSNLIGSVSGPTAVGSNAANPPVLIGGTTNAQSNGPVQVQKIDSSGNLYNALGAYTQNAVAAWTSATTLNTTQTLLANPGAQAIYVQLDQTTTFSGGVVTWQGTYDGTNWVTLNAWQVVDPTSLNPLGTTYTFVASTNKPFLIYTAGMQGIRANLTTGITGSGTVTFYVSAVNYPVASPIQGIYQSSLPSLTNGQQSVAQLDSSARQIVVGAGTAGTATGGVVTVQGVASGTNLNVAVAANTAATPAGTNVIGFTEPAAATSGGASTFNAVLSNTTNATNVKSTAGQVYTITISNNSTNLAYLKMSNLGTAPTCGTTAVVQEIMVPASNTVTYTNPVGDAYATGIAFCVTGAIATTDTTVLSSASEYVLTISYK